MVSIVKSSKRERERDLNPGDQPSDGSSHQLFGQVQPRTVQHHRGNSKRSSSSIYQEEGIQDIQQSSSRGQEVLSEDYHSTQDKRVRILNPIMGVPISFLDKYSPEQFEIVGIAKRGAGDPSLKTKVYSKEDYENYSDLNAGPVIVKDGTPRNTYPRILIQHKTQHEQEK